MSQLAESRSNFCGGSLCPGEKEHRTVVLFQEFVKQFVLEFLADNEKFLGYCFRRCS